MGEVTGRHPACRAIRVQQRTANRGPGWATAVTGPDSGKAPDTGPGLTAAGKRLVRRCNELGIMLDVSHLNEAGFWDLAGITTAPIVATHSNAHAHTRVRQGQHRLGRGAGHPPGDTDLGHPDRRSTSAT